MIALTVNHPTHQQCQNQSDTAPPVTTGRELDTTQPEPDNNENINTNATHSPRTIAIDDKSHAILAQLWITIAQPEEINIQFARLPNKLTVPLPNTTHSNPSGKYLHQPATTEEILRLPYNEQQQGLNSAKSGTTTLLDSTSMNGPGPMHTTGTISHTETSTTTTTNQ